MSCDSPRAPGPEVPFCIARVAGTLGTERGGAPMTNELRPLRDYGRAGTGRVGGER